MRKRRWFLGLSLTTLLVACGLSVVNQQSLSPSPGVTLTVGAASDLQFAFEEMGKQFEQETNTKVVFNFGSTGQLAQQIAQGAPMDLFAAANKAFVEDLDRKGRVISDTKQIYGRGRIVLWVRQDSPLAIKQIQELTNPAIKRIAIALAILWWVRHLESVQAHRTSLRNMVLYQYAHDQAKCEIT